MILKMICQSQISQLDVDTLIRSLEVEQTHDSGSGIIELGW